MTGISNSFEAEEAPDLVPTRTEEPASGREFRSLRRARREAIDRFEVEYVRALLERAGGNVTRAAAIADVSRQVIHKLIAKHRL
ncbi:MAG TPA: helix-turn-helix domain-containing protein [Polyangiaceae bacterium]|nr:helix-turn-helix domain-containing protein [Polyangiaceae bacterium]